MTLLLCAGAWAACGVAGWYRIILHFNYGKFKPGPSDTIILILFPMFGPFALAGTLTENFTKG